MEPTIDIYQAIQKIELATLAHEYGYKNIDKTKSTSRWLKLHNKTSNETILINKEKNIYRNTASTDLKFKNTFSFIIEHPNRIYKENNNPTKEEKHQAILIIKSLAENNVLQNTSFKKYQPSKQQIEIKDEVHLKKLIDYQTINLKNPRETDYLQNYRKIGSETLKHFRESIYTIKKSVTINTKPIPIQNTAFPLKNKNNQIKNFVERYYTKKENSYQSIKRISIESSTENLLWYHIPKNPNGKIAIFENEIDALSAYQLETDNQKIYTSTSGTINSQKIELILNEIPKIARIPSNKLKYELSFDNDHNGLIYTISFLSKAHYNDILKVETNQLPHGQCYTLKNKDKILAKNKSYKELKSIIERLASPKNIEYKTSLLKDFSEDNLEAIKKSKTKDQKI